MMEIYAEYTSKYPDDDDDDDRIKKSHDMNHAFTQINSLDSMPIYLIDTDHPRVS